jgi:deazaflavin-dependent oxidoreductase (nitroreductase family)
LVERKRIVTEPPYLYLTTTGRKTGLPRQIEIWFVEHDGCWYLVSGGHENSDWVKNLAATPTAEVRIGERDAPAIAITGRAIDNAAEPTLAGAVSAKMDAKYNWSDGLIIQLCPMGT